MYIALYQWIFFDVGSTLVDETEAYSRRIREMIAGTEITFEEFDERRICFAKQGLNGDAEAAKYFGLKKTPWHSELEVPFEDTKRTLEYLHGHGYKLGIIANQEPGTDKRLETWGLRQFFDVVAASAELGAEKPDREIFEKALKMADCKPENAVMVGDRLDNDIAPAKKVGMKTVWIRKGLAVYQNSQTIGCEPDYTVDSLSELLNIF